MITSTRLIIVNGQGDDHKVVSPQPAINNVKDPLQVSKVSNFKYSTCLKLIMASRLKWSLGKDCVHQRELI